MKVAALDLGTNTFLLLVAEVVDGKIERVIHDEVRVIRLGQGVNESRAFHPDALKRAAECFKDYSALIKKLGAERVLACATSAARDVTNQQTLLDIADQCGIPLEIISGEREAELTFSGTISNLSAQRLNDPVLIIDIGGGSTEFILGVKSRNNAGTNTIGNVGGSPLRDVARLGGNSSSSGGGILARRSLNIGAVRLTEMFLTQHPIPSSDFAKLDSFIRDQLRDLRRDFPVNIAKSMIAVAGTPTTLAALDLRQSFDAEKIDGYILSKSNIESWVTRLAGMSVLERQALAGMEPKRADVLVAGSLILAHACSVFDVDEIEVSIRGLRYGIAKSLGPSSSEAARS